jgi:hypothetical protein
MAETRMGTGVQKNFLVSQISSRIKLQSFVHIQPECAIGIDMLPNQRSQCPQILFGQELLPDWLS